MIWEVAVFSPPYRSFYYKVSDIFPSSFWKSGLRVIVPFRASFKVGILVRREQSPQRTLENLKSIFFPMEFEPLLNEDYIVFLEMVAKHYATSLSEVLWFVLPSGFKKIRGGIRIKANGKKIFFKELFSSDSHTLFTFAQLLLKKEAEFFYKEGKVTDFDPVIELADPNKDIPRKNKRQCRLVNHLKFNGPQKLSILKKEFGGWVKGVVEDLCKKGILKKILVYEKELLSGECFSSVGVKLTLDQQKALNSLLKDLDLNLGGVRLLFGITGSGKTQVYIHLLKEVLKRGRSALFLVPEVALGYHLFQEIEKHLRPWKCYFYHGYLPSAEREKIFLEILWAQNPFVVVGTRSSVFLPYISWRLIIIDEEHDSSFKQEERFFYNARDVAFYLCKKSSALLLLGSATPDIKTFYSATCRNFPALFLKTRVNRRPLPDVEVVKINSSKTILTERSKELLIRCIEKGEQAILLLNRRGYAPIVFCLSCKSVLKCENCSISLTYHREKGILLCHYCGESIPFPIACPRCGSTNYLHLLEGTEKVEEHIKTLLGPSIKTLRLDRDSVRSQRDIENLLKSFSTKKAQVLLGTQMCSKGYHFPDVTLVIVVDGDIGLNLPDYRAGERIFSLLLQVCGRAGRGEKKGRVIIQTRNPDHYFWEYISKSDYIAFFKKEIQLRKKYNYPPFTKLALLRISYPKGWQKGEEKLQELTLTVKRLIKTQNLEVMGPAPAPVKMIKQRLRYHCILKAKTWSEIRGVYTFLMSSINNKDPRFKVQLDMDPVQLI